MLPSPSQQQPVCQISWKEGLSLVYIIVLGGIYCSWAWFKAVGLFPASVAASGTLSIPIIGVFSSSILLREPIGLYEIVALLLVVMALKTIMVVVKRF